MAFAGLCEPPHVWTRSSTEPSGSAITVITSGDCCAGPAGVDSSLSSVLRSETKLSSSSASRSAGLAIKKAVQDQTTTVWVDKAGFYLPSIAVHIWDPQEQMLVPLTHNHLSSTSERDHAPRATVPVSASYFLRCSRGGGLPAGVIVQGFGQAGGDLGWLSHPLGTGGQRLSQPRDH